MCNSFLLLFLSVSNDDDEGDKEKRGGGDGDDSDSSQTIPASPAVSNVTNKSEDDRKENSSSLLPFPSASEINGRLRRLVTSYQRTNKKMEMRKEANVRVSVSKFCSSPK